MKHKVYCHVCKKAHVVETDKEINLIKFKHPIKGELLPVFCCVDDNLVPKHTEEDIVKAFKDYQENRMNRLTLVCCNLINKKGVPEDHVNQMLLNFISSNEDIQIMAYEYMYRRLSDLYEK